MGFCFKYLPAADGETRAWLPAGARVHAGILVEGESGDSICLTADARTHRVTVTGVPNEAELCSALFVYGTLMRGECRHPHLARGGGFERIAAARAPGVLLDCGEYPGLVPSGDGERVTGELVWLSDPERAIAVLDEVEGFNGFGRADSWYGRALVEAEVDGEFHLAWTYTWLGRTDLPCIPSGNWRTRGAGLSLRRTSVRQT